MVDKKFLEAVDRARQDLETTRGDVNLFALLKMDEVTNKWTVVTSAPWVVNTAFEDIFSDLRVALIEHVGDDMTTIARISILELDNHLSELLIEQFESGESIQSDQAINGNIVHEGYLLKVVKP